MNPFNFTIPLTVRVSELNYGNHVGYQHFFSYFQEARIAYLDQFGFSELDIGGGGLIVAEANCQYKQELCLKDQITVGCAAREIRSKMFLMAYEIVKDNAICAKGFTKNLCYDYTAKSVIRIPEVFVEAIGKFENIA